MGIGASVFLLAVGAILSFAVSASVPNANLDMIGVILMIAGGIGLLVSVAVGASRRDETVVSEHTVDRDHRHPARGY